jgi:hypothetical protein
LPAADDFCILTDVSDAKSVQFLSHDDAVPAIQSVDRFLGEAGEACRNRGQNQPKCSTFAGSSGTL